jgi:putative peptidoglycan lipid II flippase
LDFSLRVVSQMLKSSGSMAAATLTSRLFGLVREIVYARFMGVGLVTDAFLLAFQIPNLFRRLLGEGALTAAFIPIFKEKEKMEGEIAMWRAANAVISGLVIAASVIVALVLAGISIALAVHQFGAKTELMLHLLRWMFPYLLAVCLAASFMGMLNARGHFFIPAMGATMLNLVMIASVLWLAPHLGRELSQQIFGLAIGVLAAGVAQAAFQLPSLWREGFRYRWVSPWQNETVRLVVTRMIPGAVGVAAFQINVLLVQALAFWVGTGILSSFYYAVRLMEFPQGVFGISLATYMLPTLSGLVAEKNFAGYRSTLRNGLGMIIFLNLIAAILLVVLADPIIRLLLQHGRFNAQDTHGSAFALQCLAPGLVAYSSVNILARAFYALGDVKTPMKISIACLAFNFLLAAALIFPLKQGGLGLANTATSICNVCLLLYLLRRKLTSLEMTPLRATFLPLAIAGVLAGLIAWFGWRFWENLLGHETIALQIGEVFAPAGAAGLVYWLVALAFKIPAAAEMAEFAFAKFKRRTGVPPAHRAR